MATLAQCDAFGFIYDQAGAPSAGTLVTLKKVVDADGNPILLGPLTTTTDVTGAYHFTVPQGSTAYVSARADQLWSCNGGTAMLVPSATSGELIPAFAPPASFAVAPPLMFIGNVLSLPKASASQDGFLSAADWNVFNAGGGASGGVASFNGRSGAVMPQLADYSSFFLQLTGGALSGALTLAADPALPMHAATRQYVDAHTSSSLLPGQYLVTDFNASGSAQAFIGSISATSKTLTLTTAGDFVVGQGISVFSASPTLGRLITKVDAIDATKKILTLHDASAQTVSGTTVQHDDTVAIQTAINTVYTNGGGKILFPAGLFRVNGPLNAINSILRIPQTAHDGTYRAISLVGACIPCMTEPMTDPNTVIQTDVIGANSDSSILAAALWDNNSLDWTLSNYTHVHLENLIFRTYDNPAISGVDLGMASAYNVVRNCLIDARVHFAAASDPTHGTFAFRGPGNQKSNMWIADFLAVQGYAVGMYISECAEIHMASIFECKSGLAVYPGYHLTSGRFLIWHCPTLVYFPGGSMPNNVDFVIDVEVDDGSGAYGAWTKPIVGHDFYDPTNNCHGRIDYLIVQGGSGTLLPASITGMSNTILTDLAHTVPSALAIISPPAATVSPTGATITWITNNPSDSQVEYGPTTAYGSSTTLNSTLVTSHSQNIPGLSPSMLYHYRVKSRDAGSNLVTSADSIFTTSAPGSVSLLSGLVSMWQLEETGTADRVDSKGTNNLACSAAITAVTGKIGNAAHFPGDRYMSKASNSTLTPGNGDFVVACWVKLDSKSTAQMFVTKTSGNTGGVYDEYFVSYDATMDRFALTVVSGPSHIYTSLLANVAGSPSLGAWYLIICWHDSSGGTINIQVGSGGTLGAIDSTALPQPMDFSTGNFSLGAYGSPSALAYFLFGTLDDVAFWKGRLLTAADRNALWNAGAGLPFASWT